MILCLIILATSKVFLQSSYAKKYISTTCESIAFNGIIYLFSSLIFINALKTSFPVIGFALIFGGLTVLFQLCYIRAMSVGNVSLTVLIVNSSMIIPILGSALFFNEQFGVLRIIGIITIVISLIFNVEKNSDKTERKWLCLAISAFVLNSALAVCQQIFGKSECGGERTSFVAWSYLLATAISFLVYLILKLKTKKQGRAPLRAMLIYGLFAGVFLGVFQLVNTKAISEIDAGLLFPIYNSGTLILSTLIGVFVLKDKLKRKQILSILVGVVGIVLINL